MMPARSNEPIYASVDAVKVIALGDKIPPTYGTRSVANAWRS